MTSVSAKFTQKEIAYLEKIAIDNDLYRGDSEVPSVGKAMKELIKWCHMNDLKIGSNSASKSDHSDKMLEQIHAIIPNLMYLIRMQLLFNSDTISDEKVAYCKKSAIDFINANCGDFQQIQYKSISPTQDDQGLNKLPININQSNWQIKKI